MLYSCMYVRLLDNRNSDQDPGTVRGEYMLSLPAQREPLSNPLLTFPHGISFVQNYN